MRELTDQINNILFHALDGTGGVPCIPGCVVPVDNDSPIHWCKSVLGTVRGASGYEVEVSVSRILQMPVGGYLSPPQIEIRTYFYVREARGRRKRETRMSPTPGFRRQVDQHICLRADQARILAPLLPDAAAVAESFNRPNDMHVAVQRQREARKRQCVDCACTFLWDESPDDSRCAQCAEAHEWNQGEAV